MGIKSNYNKRNIMKIKMTASILVLALSLGAAELRVKPEEAVICAPPQEKKAAEELQSHLQLITGRKLPIVNEKELPEKKYVFHIGKIPPGASTEFKPEEARWDITPDTAYFYGDKSGGTQNAVYDFLESELGVRWPELDDIAYRKQNPVILKTGKKTWIPRLRIRSLRWDSANRNEAEKVWRTRMRFGGHDQPLYGHAFMTWWNRYGKKHPEYFALNSLGTRAPAPRAGDNRDNPAAYQGKTACAIKMCVSSPELIKQVIANWDKKKRYINLCENDSPPMEYCRCPECRKLDTAKDGENFERHVTDRYINFANRVAAEARQYNPDVRVVLYAYNETEQVPRREQISRNLTIGIVPTVFDLPGTGALLQSWQEKGLTECFWRPNQHHYFNTGLLPFGFEKHFYDIIQLACQHHAIGFDYDMPSGNVTTRFSDYVLAKTLQDPSKPFEYWEKHYLASFGNAADEIGEYYRYWRTNWTKRIHPNLKNILIKGKYFNFVRGIMWDPAPYFKEADFDRTDAILKKALQKQLEPEERKRVEALVTANQHARLICRAATRKTDEDSAALLKFREDHKLELIPAVEKAWGDVTGVVRVSNFKDFTPPYLVTDLFWFFKLDPQDAGLKEGWQKSDFRALCKWGEFMPTNNFWETPHSHYQYPSKEMRQKTARYDGIAWYALALSLAKVPKDWKEREIYLYFGAVDESCRVYVNGKEAGTRLYQKADDWTTPFTIRIDPYLDWSKATQLIVVRVEDKAGMGGIWKRVWLVSK